MVVFSGAFKISRHVFFGHSRSTMFASCGPFLVLKSHTATALGMILAALCDANIRTSRFINHDRRSVREQKNIFRYGQVNKGETKRPVQRQFACVHVCVCQNQSMEI